MNSFVCVYFELLIHTGGPKFGLEREVRRVHQPEADVLHVQPGHSLHPHVPPRRLRLRSSGGLRGQGQPQHHRHPLPLRLPADGRRHHARYIRLCPAHK